MTRQFILDLYQRYLIARERQMDTDTDYNNYLKVKQELKVAMAHGDRICMIVKGVYLVYSNYEFKEVQECTN